MKSLKEIPFNKIHKGMKLSMKKNNSELDAEVIATKRGPLTISIDEGTGEVSFQNETNQIVLDIQGGPFTNVDHQGEMASWFTFKE